VLKLITFKRDICGCHIIISVPHTILSSYKTRQTSVAIWKFFYAYYMKICVTEAVRWHNLLSGNEGMSGFSKYLRKQQEIKNYQLE
jgi:hypothetical protein